MILKGINVMKRLLCALFALLMLLTAFAGCASDKKTTDGKPATSELDEETKKLYETVVLTLDGEPVTYEKYRYYYNIGLTTYLESNNNKLGEDAEKEINEIVLTELKKERAIEKLAKEFGIELTDKDIESVDSYIESQKYYAALQGGSKYEETLAENYCTLDVFREWMLYYYFIESGVYDYLYDEENNAIDRSDEVIRRHLEEQNAVLHILLTKKNYSTEENTEKLAKALSELLSSAIEVSKTFTAETTNEEAVAKLNSFISAYNTSKEALSYVGSFSDYAEKVTVLHNQLSATGASPAIVYFKEVTDMLTASDDVTKALKAVASFLSADGFTENSKKEMEDAYSKYAEYINKKKLAYFGVSDDEDFDPSTATYPTGKEYSALYAAELVRATYEEQQEGKSGKLVSLAQTLLEDAFSYAVLTFGEDRQDHENGVYFKKGEIDDTFEEAYFKLEMSQISAPVKTEYGYHVIYRIPTDFDYYKEFLYDELAVTEYIDQATDNVKVELTDFYHTIKPDTLK